MKSNFTKKYNKDNPPVSTKNSFSPVWSLLDCSPICSEGSSIEHKESDPSHFIFEINVGKKRFRDTTTLNLSSTIDFKLIWNFDIQFQRCSMSDPPLPDIDIKNKMVWFWSSESELPLKLSFQFNLIQSFSFQLNWNENFNRNFLCLMLAPKILYFDLWYLLIMRGQRCTNKLK